MYRNDDYFPRNYWANTSDNSLIRGFADIADEETKEEMEVLLAGGTIIWIICLWILSAIWMVVKSNREAGNGRLDIVIFKRRGKDAVIFELKCVKDEKKLEQAANTALEQISRQNYDSYFTSQMPTKITHYGISFYKKKCFVMKE